MPSRPSAEEAFLAAVAPRVREVLEWEGEARVVAFSPANNQLIAGALRRIREEGTWPGSRFLEWGSGLGIVTCLAAMQGFDARGVEIEADLVAIARRIATEHGIDARFEIGSYRVEGTEPIEADLVYAYPWPAEERFIFEEFERRAPEGCLLLTFHGGGDLRIRTQGPS